MSDLKPDLQHDNLSFDDTEIAFRNKSDADLERAYWLFRAIGSNFLTTIGPPVVTFGLKVGLPLEPLIKKTVFRQFCGGETIEECERVIEDLSRGNVGTILDYAVEGEEREDVFDTTAEEIVRTIDRAKGDRRIPLTVFKPTGVARFDLLAKISAKHDLSADEIMELDRVEARVDKICRSAFAAAVPVMVDAEESWIQNAIDDLVLKMMRKYNREAGIVCNTYQLYRWEAFENLKRQITLATTGGFILGAKLVRGAYMEKERKRASEMGYPSPIQPDKSATDRDYNAALDYCVQHLDHVKLIAGTHNEESCRSLVNCMRAYRIEHGHHHIYFSQLLGMSDNLTFNLAEAGYNVAKYVPYGPVRSVLPYLFRRAEENTAIAGQTGRELGLIIKENRRRHSDEKRAGGVSRDHNA